MVDLFGTDGRAALNRLARSHALYAFDFDGTLSPIVDRPDDAKVRPDTERLLRSLGTIVPTVLLTGRAVDDVSRRIDFEPKYVIGNHGVEGLPAEIGAAADHDAHRRAVRGWVEQWPSAFGSVATTGIVVEPKEFSISVHYRAAKDHAVAMRCVGAAIARLDPPPRVIGGKCVFNLLPEGTPDKGRALQALVAYEHADGAFFIGDDLTDEAAFIGAPLSWVTVRVGEYVHSHARYFIADQRDIDRCLRTLLDTVRSAR